MPAKIGYRRKKRTIRKRYKKRSMRMTRAVRPNTLNVKRKFYLASWTWTTTTTNDFWRYQTIIPSNIPNFAEYASVFDTYRINAIKYTYMPRYTDVEAASAGTTGTPTAYAHFVVDSDSTILPSGIYGSATLNTLMENTRCVTRQLNKPFSIYYKPKVMQGLLGAGTAGFARRPPFIRSTETSTDHRGHHMYVQQNNFSASAAGNIVLDIFVTVYMTLKNVK
jgi:hypothetical protein